MTRAETWSLEANSDALISLHRSEGFGLVIAEMMSLGKPVICTNYSGSTDFASQSNTFLVEFSNVPVRRGQYTANAHQIWADPELADARRQMRLAVSNDALRLRLGKAAADEIARSFSLATVGEIVERRLATIRSSLEIPTSARPEVS